MSDKFFITFAGVVGSSKTPIAYYLSWKLNLPILNNDAIRTEVSEDLGIFSEEEYKKRRNERILEVLKKNSSIIYDASIDREWKNWQDKIIKSGYKVFIISLDLSREFLNKLYKIKGYQESQERLDQLLSDHEEFLKNYNDIINLHITEKEFKNRLEISCLAVNEWLKK